MAQDISKMETTAVEWLMEEWPALKYQLPEWLVEQAKAMEKEQIIKAFGVGCQVESTRLIGYHDMAEQYYNENYNQ